VLASNERTQRAMFRASFRAGTITESRGAEVGADGDSSARERDRATRIIASGGSRIHGAAAASAQPDTINCVRGAGRCARVDRERDVTIAAHGKAMPATPVIKREKHEGARAIARAPSCSRAVVQCDEPLDPLEPDEPLEPLEPREPLEPLEPPNPPELLDPPLRLDPPEPLEPDEPLEPLIPPDEPLEPLEPLNPPDEPLEPLEPLMPPRLEPDELPPETLELPDEPL
jgi:hypothetical protein